MVVFLSVLLPIKVRAVREIKAMVMVVARPMLFSHSATCAINCELTLNITRTLSGHALNGPVVFRANNASSIWCSAIFVRRRTLSDFFWQYSNGTRVYTRCRQRRAE